MNPEVSREDLLKKDFNKLTRPNIGKDKDYVMPS
jgi:hypothetical protein